MDIPFVCEFDAHRLNGVDVESECACNVLIVDCTTAMNAPKSFAFFIDYFLRNVVNAPYKIPKGCSDSFYVLWRQNAVANRD